MAGILLATHGEPSADGAARVASHLATRLQVPLTCLVVYEPMPVVDYGYGISYVPTPEDDEAVRSALVAGTKAQFKRCGLGVAAPEVRTGAIASEITAAAREHHVDLIVTGLGSHNIVDRALGGETALQLAQNASTPVLAVPGSATASPRRTLAAIDFSATSARAAQVAASWLRAGDELHLVSVVPERRASGRAAATTTEQSVVARLTQFGSELGLAKGVGVDAAELAGDAARTLLDRAEQIDADLITLGSHGYGAVKRLVLGSVASKIIRVTTRAVLVAPIGCLPA
jgi:nucleotide-binding universal stress UspA family protein